jgi:CubicO group peptidase (beta-lactamase class C family)
VDTELQARIDRAADETDFSGIVQVLRRGEPLCSSVRGLADRAHGIENRQTTRFPIASGSKGFTALAILSLVADGSLELGTTARTVLGNDLPLIASGVTIAHLLGHTSGIGDYLDESAVGDVNDYVMPVPVHRLATTSDFLAVLDGHPQKFEPGERFEYCNGGFVVLAVIAERVSGSAFHDLVDERVLGPAGMRETGYLRSDELPGTAAFAYVPAESGLRTNQLHLPVRGTGDGGAYSTAGDIASFWPALFAGQIVPRSLVDEALRPRSDVPVEEKRYGLGFWLRADRPTAMLEGYDAGVSFRTAYDPESEVLYTVMSNTPEGAWPFAELLDDVLPSSPAGRDAL